MKNIVTLFTAILLASPLVYAEGFYLSAGISHTDTNDKIFNDGMNGAGNPKISLDSDIRYGLAIGYEIKPAFNLELEYSKASYDSISDIEPGSGNRSQDEFSIDSTIDADMLTMNVSYGFENSSAFTPYVEAGLGSTFYNIEGDLFVSGFMGTDAGGFLPATFSYKGKGTEFTYFVGLGVAWQLAEKTDLTLSYRHSDLGQISSKYDQNGDRLQAEMKTNDIRLGLKLHY